MPTDGYARLQAWKYYVFIGPLTLPLGWLDGPLTSRWGGASYNSHIIQQLSENLHLRLLVNTL